ncbi:MAG: RAD55 family ATPase, partial [Candidatus Bathyarchaeia archaeon]
NSYMHQGSIGASYFNHIFILLKDGQGSPIPEKECVIVNQLLKMEVRGITNSTGSLEMVLPSSDVAGEYGVLIRWENYTFNIPFSTLNLLDRTVDLRLPIYELKVKILFYLIPMPLANVTLYRGSKWIANGTTGWSGSTSFHQIPADKYRLHVDYFYQKYDQEIEVEGPQEVVVTIRDRYILSLMVLGLIAIIGALLVAALKTQDKPRKHPFSFIDKIIEDGLPFEASIMISGPPASGKSVLMSNMMNESLRKGRKCIYIINTDFPSKVRENLENLDVDVKKHEKEKRFLIIDCYSGVAGKTSSEAHHVDSVTDLTRIGIELSLCLEELGHKTDIYFDSFSTALAALKPEQITSFLHTTGAKVKGLSGRFCFTVGTDLPKDLISKMDEASDCSIELTVERMDHEVQRMLWIKKVRGKWHYTRAIPFIIEKRRGVVFLAPKKILKRSYP